MNRKKKIKKHKQLLAKRKHLELSVGKFGEEWWKLEYELEELERKLWPWYFKVEKEMKKTEWDSEKMKYKTFKSFWENPEKKIWF